MEKTTEPFESEELLFQRWAHDPALGSTARRQLATGFVAPAHHDIESELSLQRLAGILEEADTEDNV